MNWEAAGAIGEVIGAVAVLATPLYLARQMKQNNALMREQASYNMLQNQLSYYDGVAREPNLVNVVYGVAADDVEATVRLKAEAHATAEFFRWQWEYLRVHEAIFSDDEVPIEAFRREWKKARFGSYWEEQKAVFHPDFVSFIDRNVADADRE